MSGAIEFRDVTFTFPGSSSPALERVTLDVPEGSFALVVGPTGAGKSTFLRAINGLVPHFSGGDFSGTVTIDGRDTRDHAPRELADHVAFVPQDPGASFVVERVEDELAYALENLGVAPAAMRRRVEETLDLLALEPLRTSSVRAISGGERQRVAIAAALTPGARVLILDEPTSQLDPQGAEDVLSALQRLVHDLGITVVLAEHRLERVSGFADIAIGLERGRVEIGRSADIIDRYADGPPVARLGRLFGWLPAPLTVREARRLAEPLAPPAPSPMPEAGEPILSSRGLHAGYGNDDVLKGIDLDVADGEIVALMGRNGAGKTTLLRCLVGLHEPTAGAVTLASGAPVEPGRDVALCPQAPDSILFKDTIADEIAATLGWSGTAMDPGSLKTDLGLDDLGDGHPRDLSAGQRLLVALAATAATGAPVLLLDEPTRGLDRPSKDSLVRYMEKHARSGAVVVATHDVELAAGVATRVVMLAGGDVIADGSPAEVLGDSPVFAPQMSRVFGPGWLTVDQVAAAVGLSESTS